MIISSMIIVSANPFKVEMSTTSLREMSFSVNRVIDKQWLKPPRLCCYLLQKV